MSYLCSFRLLQNTIFLSVCHPVDLEIDIRQVSVSCALGSRMECYGRIKMRPEYLEGYMHNWLT